VKLSNLYTRDLVSEAGNPFKDVMHLATKAFGRAKTTPDPREARIKMIIREIFQEVWGDYYDDPKALARIESFKHSIEQFMPQFLKMQDEESIKNEVETLFRARAERIVGGPTHRT
jgi:hypothetical protein